MARGSLEIEDISPGDPDPCVEKIVAQLAGCNQCYLVGVGQLTQEGTCAEGATTEYIGIAVQWVSGEWKIYRSDNPNPYTIYDISNEEDCIEGEVLCTGGTQSEGCDEDNQFTISLSIEAGGCAPADPDTPIPCQPITEDPLTELLNQTESCEVANESEEPVALVTGHKIERATDLRVALPGRDFLLRREYSSDPDLLYGAGASVAPGEVGANWVLGTSLRVLGDGGALWDSPPDELYMVGMPLASTRIFTNAGSGIYRQEGASRRYIERVTTEYDPFITSSTYFNSIEGMYVWRYKADGGREMDFFALGVDEFATPVPLAGIQGRLVRETDEFGNEWFYDYSDIMDGSEVFRTRVSKIYLNGQPNVGSGPAATVEFTWFDTSASLHLRGRLRSVEVYRPDGGSGSVLTQRVVYLYWLSGGYNEDVLGDGTADDSVLFAANFGTNGDLCEVIRSVRVDTNHADSTDLFHHDVTQYRYHPNGTTVQIDGLSLSGTSHQLKAVFSPAQIAFYADETGGTHGHDSARTAAEDLRGLELMTLEGTSSEFPTSDHWTYVYDLASKLVSYGSQADPYDDELDDTDNHLFRVTTQFILGDCGCAGPSGSEGKRYDYAVLPMYWNGVTTASASDPSLWPGHSMRVIESHRVGSDDYKPYRARFHDFVRAQNPGGTFAIYKMSESLAELDAGEAPYTVPDNGDNVDIVESTVGMDTIPHVWSSVNLWHMDVTQDYTHPEASGETVGFKYLRGVVTPASATEWQPVGVGASSVRNISFAGNETHGLVNTFGWETTTSGFMVGKVLGVQDKDDTNSWVPTLYERYEGPNYRVTLREEPAITTGGADVVTEFEYGTDGDNDMVWVKRTQEMADVGNNGPSTDTTPADAISYELYDQKGQLRWVKSEDGTLEYREYDALTGRVTLIVSNADKDDPYVDSDGELNTTNFPSASFATSWARATGAPMIRQMEYDVLGRLVATTDPSGAMHYIQREVRYADMDFGAEARGVPHMVTVSLPHFFNATDGFDGAATLTWKDAAGRTLRVSDYLVNRSADYDPVDGTSASTKYTLIDTDGDVARTINDISISGSVVKTRSWNDLSGDRTGGGEIDTTELVYDALGRLQKTIDAEDGVREMSYDVLDRVTQVQEYVDGDSSGTITAQYYYDSPQNTDFAIGNGNLTLERMPIRNDDPNTTPADETVLRDVKRWYDFRDRVIGVMNPEPPHQTVVYDDQSRVTAMLSWTAWSGGTPPTATGPGSSALSVVNEFVYDRRGQLVRERVAVDPTDSMTSYLETNYWYDVQGRQAAVWAPNGPGVKTAYDPHSRAETVYTTDRGGDDAPGAADNWTHATDASLTSDTVIEQVEYSYQTDGSGNDTGLLELVTTRMRLPAGSGPGPLTGANSLATHRGLVYDAAGRMTDSLWFGTNNGPSDANEFGVGTSAPSPSTDFGTDRSTNTRALISSVGFDQRGRVVVSIDPEGTETAYKFDDLSRRVAVVEARSDVDPAEDITWDNTGGLWDVAWPMSAPPDQDRVTTFVYDGISNVIKRVAHLNDDTTQITQYTYGTSEPVASPGSMDSLVASSRLLDTVAYPDESTGAPGTTDAYKVSYAYNIQGELIGMTDQNGTLHTYDRDGLGRVTDDRVADYDDQATYPIAVDVRRISADFDDHGRLEDVRTYNAATGGDEVNFVGFEYNTLHQVTAVAQNHDSATPSAEEEVEYDYTASPAVGSGNHSRITAMRYPAEAGGSTATVEYTYDTGIDNTISRVSSIDQPGITGALAAYTYLGQGMVTKVLYEHLDVRLDRKIRPDASTVTGATVFPGFDRFGRIAHQSWVNDDFGSSNPNPLLSRGYAYDRASNRLMDIDLRPGSEVDDQGWWYEYDPLDRLAEAHRGERASSSTDTPADGAAWTAADWVASIGSEAWTLGMLGNWDKFERDENGDEDYADTIESEERSHNKANEITIIPAGPTQGTSGATLTYEYDDDGNLRRARRTAGGNVADIVHVYDAWNRLVEVHRNPGGTLIGEYEYNGLGWRTVRRYDDSKAAYNGIDAERRYYYSASWQLLEEHIDDDDSGSMDRVGQQVWGVRYIDDAVSRRMDLDADGDYEAVYAYLTDALFSVRAVLNSDASIIEYLDYSAYGADPIAVHRYAGDLDGDKVLGTGDISALQTAISASDYIADADLVHDGVLDFDDLSEMAARINAGYDTSMPSPWLSDPNRADVASDNSVGFAGYWSDLETGTYSVRYRHYAPRLGRWLQRDPLGFPDGQNRYRYVRSDPVDFSDPTGLYPPVSPTVIHIMDCQEQLDRLNSIADSIRQHCPDTGADMGLFDPDSHIGTMFDVLGLPAEGLAAADGSLNKWGLEPEIKRLNGTFVRDRVPAAARRRALAPLEAQARRRAIRGAFSNAGGAVFGTAGCYFDCKDAFDAASKGDVGGAVSSGSSAIAGVAGPALTTVFPPAGVILIAGELAATYIEYRTALAIAKGENPECNGECDFLRQQLEQRGQKFEQSGCLPDNPDPYR